MKKIFIVLGVILIVQSRCWGVSSCAAEDGLVAFNLTQEEDVSGIKKVVETYLHAFGNRDMNSMINQISEKYSAKIGEKAIDYEAFKKEINALLERMVDMSISDINMMNPDISNDTASISVKFNLQGYNLNTLNSFKEAREIKFILTKEDGIWKITSRTILGF